MQGFNNPLPWSVEEGAPSRKASSKALPLEVLGYRVPVDGELGSNRVPPLEGELCFAHQGPRDARGIEVVGNRRAGGAIDRADVLIGASVGIVEPFARGDHIPGRRLVRVVRIPGGEDG